MLDCGIGAAPAGPKNAPERVPTPESGPTAGLAEARTLADFVWLAGRNEPQRAGYSFLTYRRDSAPEIAQLTYGELLERGLAIAANLQRICDKGERVIILCPPGLDYIAAFFGCQLGGFVAVPACPPRNIRRTERLESILRDADATVILAQHDMENKLSGWAGNEIALPVILSVDRIDPADGRAFSPPVIEPGDLAFLQYTSGTTGDPKGVMVSHAQVVDNVRRIQEVWEVERSSCVLLWLPPFHDMGLVDGLIVPLVRGARSVLMSPTAFLNRPFHWLQGISRFRATHTIAPNFAYQLCIDTISDEDARRLDLSSLVSAASAAEPIGMETVTAFATKFAPAGFRPEQSAAAYGLAEMVVLASARKGLSAKAVNATPCAGSTPKLGRSEGRCQFAVSHGSIIEGHDVRIVDPDSLMQCPDGAVGEIWLSGPSAASGYWKKPVETEAIFLARLADAPESGPYLRTSDLGALIDGELVVLGRVSEMIHLGGRAYYPQDLEAVAADCHPAVGNDRTIAFSCEDPDEDRVILVHEPTRSMIRSLDPDSLADALREAIHRAYEIDVHAVVFVKPTHLPRTTSGKPQRSRARERFMNGELAEISRWERDSLLAATA